MSHDEQIESPLRSFEGARDEVLVVARQRMMTTVRSPLLQARGRILTADVLANDIHPSFDNAAMDGILVRSLDVAQASPKTPVRFLCQGSIAAGDRLEHERFEAPFLGGKNKSMSEISNSFCFEIMTGAPLPNTPKAKAYFDAVIRFEDLVEVSSGPAGRVFETRKPVIAGHNVRRTGEDFGWGNVLAKSGQVVTSGVIMALAAAGVSHVPVRRRPRAVIISTGNELVPHDSIDAPRGSVRNSSGPFLEASLRALGCKVVAVKVLPDDHKKSVDTLKSILTSEPDLIVSTGSVSMGKADILGAVLQEVGARIHFHKVAMRPGKPILFATFASGPVVFALPGNPASTAVGMQFFVSAFVDAVTDRPARRTQSLSLDANWNKSAPAGYRWFLKARKQGDKGVHILSGQDSFMVAPFCEAEGWAIILENRGDLNAGDSIEFLPFEY